MVMGWYLGPDLNRHDLNNREISSSLHYGSAQDNPPKCKSNAILDCVRSRADALTQTYECQESVTEPPRGLTLVVIAMVTGQRH